MIRYLPRSILWLLLGLMALPAPALTPTDAKAEKYLKQRAIVVMDQIREGILDAKGMREPDRTRRLDELMDNVVAPLLGKQESLAEFYGKQHWAEVERLNRQHDALTAAATLLRDNYLFILERSIKKKIKVQRVTVNGPNAEVLLRIFARKTLPMEIELRRFGNSKWVVHDAVFLGTSVREGMKRQLADYIEEHGIEGAIDELLSLRADAEGTDKTEKE